MTIDRADGRVDLIAEVPGYARGLAFADFLRLCGPVEDSRNGDVWRLAHHQSGWNETERKCGVWVIDISNGQTVAFLEFQSEVEEIFDVQILAGIRLSGGDWF